MRSRADHAARHRRAHDKRAEDRVQADEIGEPRAQRHERESDHKPRLGQRPVLDQPRLGAVRATAAPRADTTAT